MKDDLIRRKDAIDTMQMFIDSLDKEATAYKSLRVAFNRCITELKRMPPAQSEMNELELQKMMLDVVCNGFGYEALKILINLLEEHANKSEMAIREIRATKKATLKFCDADISNKRKVEMIRELWQT